MTTNQGLLLKVCNMYCSNPEDKEDLFQDIVLQLWRAYGSFNGGSRMSTWIYRVALNTAITRLRKTSKRERYEGLDEQVLEIAATDNKEENEQVLQMYAAIKKLSAVDRAITILYMDGHSYREIAGVMGLSESNVGFLLNKIRTKLKTIVNNGQYGTGRL
ncbi:RNA polymerase subunit sigma-70 [Chitinophaga parva]|uniref:RNA polymerase subunit sigma-70 n=1 Tax=Chitinophaga parva TaxID=2169414 RepID=A0A2T7BJH3_9BACT|nr:RNA polymerase subunit sigma-70 [Chitinophaga parva]